MSPKPTLHGFSSIRYFVTKNTCPVRNCNRILATEISAGWALKKSDPISKEKILKEQNDEHVESGCERSDHEIQQAFRQIHLRSHDSPVHVFFRNGCKFGGGHIYRKENHEAVSHVRPSRPCKRSG